MVLAAYISSLRTSLMTPVIETVAVINEDATLLWLFIES